MKRELFVFVFVILIVLNFVSSQSAQDALGNLPGGTFVGGVEIDPNTGLPKKFSDFKERAEEFKTLEQDENYFNKEWTKIFAQNKIIGPILFYTDKFFSFFNFLWKFSFGTTFSWSWFFFVALGLWVTLIIVFYYPVKEMLNSQSIALIVSILLASIAGVSGVIPRAVGVFTPLILNIWLLLIVVGIVMLLIFLYQKLMKDMKEESEEVKLERAKKNIKAHGEVSEKFLKG